MAETTAVLQPNLGLYTTMPSLTAPKRALVDGMNFRIKDGRITNIGLGWQRFQAFTLNGPATLIDNFFIRGLEERLIFGTPTDLYQYDSATETVLFITPIYATGTAAASGTAVTGTGTTWLTNAKEGDEISFGANDETDPAATWFEIASVDADDGITLTATAGTVVDGPYTIRQRFTGDLENKWNTATFVNAAGVEDLWFATNGIDFVVKWNGQDPQVESLSGLGIRAKHLVVFQNMMIYGNVTQAGDSLPTDILNSDIGDPEDLSTGLSEQFRIIGEVGEIVDMVPLGDNLAIYLKDNDNIVLMQFIGDPFIFVFRRASTAVSALANGLVCDMSDYHLIIAKEAQYRFDGASIVEVGQQFWPLEMRSIDTTRLYYAFHHKNRENGEIIWALPRTSDTGAGEEVAVSPEVAHVDHYLETVSPREPVPVSRRSFPFISSGVFFQSAGVTWDTVEGEWDEQVARWNDRLLFDAFPLILVGNTDGEIFTVGNSNLADGATLTPSFVHFSKRATFDGRMRGLISRVYPFANDPEGIGSTLNVTLYLYDHEYGDPTVSSAEPFDLTLNESEFFVAPYRRARFFETRFTAQGAGTWALEGFDVDVRTGGKR